MQSFKQSLLRRFNMSYQQATYSANSPIVKNLDPVAEQALATKNLAFVVGVDFDGNVTLYAPDRVHLLTPPNNSVDYPVTSQRIVKLIESAIVVFDQNPRCIRMKIDGMDVHVHT
jgi:hypothetical protein